MNTKKERLKLTPEQLFNIYLECTAPGAPVKTILERYGLKPWDLFAIRKKVRLGAIEALANAKPGRKKHVVAVASSSSKCQKNWKKQKMHLQQSDTSYPC